ncbi:MAG TPA: DinB family protein [Candidatus Angelobacter sp.]|nr:DinB family protein [Candidatus Angelobacter sp.]
MDVLLNRGSLLRRGEHPKKTKIGQLRYTADIAMEITEIGSFIDYYENIRQRTLKAIRCIPPEKFDWTYQEGKFTFADLIRHIAAIERYMYAENVQFKPSRYPGHGKELADGYENVLAFMDQKHQETISILRTLTAQDLQKKCVTPSGANITVWKWLRAMVEHEVHHRGQIYLYLSLLSVPSPPLYGMTSEQVREKTDLKA